MNNNYCRYDISEGCVVEGGGERRRIWVCGRLSESSATTARQAPGVVSAARLADKRNNYWQLDRPSGRRSDGQTDGDE